MIIKHLYTEKNTHLGGEARFGYVHLPLHSELYLVKEVKQTFRLFGIPFKLTTQLDMFPVPIETVSLMTQSTSGEDGSINLDITAYRTSMTDLATQVRADMLKAVKANKDLSEEQKNDIIVKLKKDQKHVDMLFEEIKETDMLKNLSVFLDNGYQVLYKLSTGVATVVYMARVLDDRVSLYAVETIKANKRYLLASIKQFYITERFMKEFLAKINKKGADIV